MPKIAVSKPNAPGTPPAKPLGSRSPRTGLSSRSKRTRRGRARAGSRLSWRPRHKTFHFIVVQRQRQCFVIARMNTIAKKQKRVERHEIFDDRQAEIRETLCLMDFSHL